MLKEEIEKSEQITRSTTSSWFCTTSRHIRASLKVITNNGPKSQDHDLKESSVPEEKILKFNERSNFKSS